jgi:hypothetical protein
MSAKRSASFAIKAAAGVAIHDTELGCINALLVAGSTSDAAIEEVLAAVSAYAASHPLCARWDWGRERRTLEGMAYSFINKFPDYTDRLPPELYATWRRRRGQGVVNPVLEYDRRRQCWHYPEPKDARTDDTEADNAEASGTKADNSGAKAMAPARINPVFNSSPSTSYGRAPMPLIWSTR